MGVAVRAAGCGRRGAAGERMGSLPLVTAKCDVLPPPITGSFLTVQSNVVAGTEPSKVARITSGAAAAEATRAATRAVESDILEGGGLRTLSVVYSLSMSHDEKLLPEQSGSATTVARMGCMPVQF